MPAAKSPETRHANPELMAYIESKIRAEAEKLLVPEQGERLNQESFARIANFVVSQIESSGGIVSKESVDEIMGNKEVTDNIIKGTIVRLETKTE